MNGVASPSFPWKKAVYPVLFVLLVGLAAGLIFHKLGQRELVAYDESRHGVNAYEMMQRGDWVVNTYQGEPDDWNLKPPLSYWAIMLGFRLFGFNSFGLRFFSAFSMLLMFVALGLWAYKRHGKIASLGALVFLLANVNLYGFGAGRAGDANAIYMLWMVLGLLCMLDSERDLRWLYGAALCFGFAFMAKSYHALLLPAVAFVYLCATGQIKKLKIKNYLLLVALGLLPILPWAIARYARDGWTFFAQMLQTDVVARVGAGGESDVGSSLWNYYLRMLLANPAVVMGGLLCALGFGGKMMESGKPSPRQIGYLLWMLLPVALYSFSSFKLLHYIHFCTVGLAIPCGWTVQWLWRNAKRGFLLASALVALAVGFAVQIGHVAYMVDQQPGPGSFQTALLEALDRDVDSGTHAYIEYAVEDRTLTTWTQNDLLCAQMQGDVLGLNGGAAAFAQDEEPALLIIDKRLAGNELLEYCPVKYESMYLYILEN